VLSGLAVVLLFCLPLAPEIAGRRRLVFRDAHVTHWPWRRVAMASLDRGEVPFVNEYSSGGQPMLANPNAVLLYPTLLLEKVLPPASAFNLHYLLHVFWAFFGARALAGRLGQSEGASFVSAVAYAFSGMLLSYTSAFANSGAASAWLPWCAAAALDLARARDGRERRRAVAAGGLAFGLQLLAGEPVISLLTVLIAGSLGLVQCFKLKEAVGGRLARFAAGGACTGLAAGLFAAPLLLPLSAVLPFTYRGQHAYSWKAFSASAFGLWRVPEWLFPRFSGDPGALGPGGHWQWALHSGEVLYIWCVTFGVLTPVLIGVAAVRPRFFRGWRVWVSAFGLAALLLAFGGALPFFRLLYQVEALRKLRYPIKFYLLTTLCVALLAGWGAEGMREHVRSRRGRAVLLGFGLVFAAALLLSADGGLLDRLVEPHLSGSAVAAAAQLPSIRSAFRSDALLGLAAVAAGALAPLCRTDRLAHHLLGFAAFGLCLPWALPLFVSGDDRDLSRPPAVAGHLAGPGRLYVDPAMAELSLQAGVSPPDVPRLVGKFARVEVEELIPETGQPFGVRGIFEPDPDGSFGWFNRLAGEALTVSTPEERVRLLRVFGGRWVLAEEAAPYPGARPVTGLSVAGRRLELFELPGSMPELRWASRAIHAASLSSALDLIRSGAFHPETDVALPGAPGEPAPDGVAAAVTPLDVRPDFASADVAAPSPGHLLFSRTYFRTWSAQVDGRSATVLVANARDLAVAVPAGSHHVTFAWDRAPFHRGVGLQAVAFAALFALAVSRAARRPLP
jgi:hypothetical protein